MGSLADVYEQSLIDEYGYPRGWMANWPANSNKRLGDVGTLSDRMFNTNATLDDKESTPHLSPAWSRRTVRGLQEARSRSASRLVSMRRYLTGNGLVTRRLGSRWASARTRA